MSGRRWSPKEKLRIVLEGVGGEVQVSEVCRRHGITTTHYYTWKRQLMDSAEAIYGRRSNGKAERRMEKLEGKLAEKDRIIAEIMGENLDLKKGRWA
jgi:transposase